MVGHWGALLPISRRACPTLLGLVGTLQALGHLSCSMGMTLTLGEVPLGCEGPR